MGVRVETRWTDDGGESYGRVHVVIQGQDCGPSVPCTAMEWQVMKIMFNAMLTQVCDKSYSIGQSDLQRKIRTAIGA